MMSLAHVFTGIGPDFGNIRRSLAKQAAKTKDHIPLAHLLHQLSDDDSHCHPEETVTLETLQAAFPNMSVAQAHHLLDEWKEKARKSQATSDDETLQRLKAMGTYIEHLAADLHTVKLNTAVCTSRLKADVRGEELEKEAQMGFGGEMDRKTGKVGRATMDGRVTIQQQAPKKAPPNPHAYLHEQVENFTQKIGEAVQQMTWQIGGAADKLASQGTALETAADGALRAAPVTQIQVPRKPTGDASTWMSQPRDNSRSAAAPSSNSQGAQIQVGAQSRSASVPAGR